MSDFLPEVIMDDATTSLSDSESIEEITDIKVEEKNTIQEEDIFVNKDKLVIKEVVEEQPPPKPKEVKTKKKRVMTEEHKAKLALAREKALAKRRENAARKKEIKQLQQEEEEQKYQQLKERVRKPKPKQEKVLDSSGVIEEELKQVKKNYTQEDLDNAVLNGIMKYEVIRKDRKKKKQEQKEKDKHEENVRNQVRQIINKPVQDYNFYDNCY